MALDWVLWLEFREMGRALMLADVEVEADDFALGDLAAIWLRCRGGLVDRRCLGWLGVMTCERQTRQCERSPSKQTASCKTLALDDCKRRTAAAAADRRSKEGTERSGR